MTVDAGIIRVPTAMERPRRCRFEDAVVAGLEADFQKALTLAGIEHAK